jgi:DNA polymerase III alpha subunit
MDFIRPLLPSDVSSTYEVYSMREGELVSVCGIGIARQHPRGHKGTIFVTVEDESSDIQLILWPDIHKKYMRVLEDPIILATGKISQQDGTTSVVVSHLETLEPKIGLPSAHNWY